MNTHPLADELAALVTFGGEVGSTHVPAELLRRVLAALRGVDGVTEPTEAMLNAARDWSVSKYGIGIGNDAAIGCWKAMHAAAAEDAFATAGKPMDELQWPRLTEAMMVAAADKPVMSERACPHGSTGPCSACGDMS